jgi:hypothetical protein
VDGGNVTIALRAISPTIPRATVTGTIAGWDTMPAPATDHNRLAVIGAVQQPGAERSRQQHGPGDAQRGCRRRGRGRGVVRHRANVCVRNSNPAALVNDCNWVLTTHSGPQAHFAILLDQDTKGRRRRHRRHVHRDRLGDQDRPVVRRRHHDRGECLQPIADADMQSFSATFASGPSGSDYVVALPVLDLGTDGRISIILPALNKTTTMTRVPKLTGPLAGAHYDMIASATDDPTKPLPATLTWLRNVEPVATVAVTSWLPPPSAIAMTGGRFSFTPVAGATLHGAELQTMDGQRRWSITILDGSTSFTLPGLSPDPLPSARSGFRSRR